MNVRFIVHSRTRRTLSDLQLELNAAISDRPLTAIHAYEHAGAGDIVVQLTLGEWLPPAGQHIEVLPWCTPTELSDKMSDLDVRLAKENKQLRHLAIAPLSQSPRTLVIAVVEESATAKHGAVSDEQQSVAAGQEDQQNPGADERPDSGAKRARKLGNRKTDKVS